MQNTIKVEVTLNDAAFLSVLLSDWMKKENMETAYLQDLVAHLKGENICL